jgi:archaemetzincin
MKTFSTLLIFIVLLAACGGAENDTAKNSAETKVKKPAGTKKYDKIIKELEPFFKPMGKPGKYDWLAMFQESGQTFDEYLAAEPNIPKGKRKNIYVQPIGKFTSAEQKAVTAAANYLHVFYQLPVKVLPTKQFPSLNKVDFRMRGYPSKRQIRTGFILDKMLKPAMPADAAALVAFTNEDLYTSETMNYVFGQASLDDRVGVWSVLRLEQGGSPEKFLTRTLKIAAHETGHMFSMRHCIKYQCLMSGTNNLAETDSRPIDACPECTAKVLYLSKADAEKRYLELADLTRKYGLKNDAAEFEKKAAAVK